MRYGRIALAAFVVLFGACGDTVGPDGSGLPPGMVDEGSWYRTGFRWPHDGDPYETPNFVVYSDGASLEARERLAEIGEELLVVLKDDFEIDAETMFRFPAGQSKIHIFAYKNHTPMEWGGWGYWGGLLIFSLDHELRSEWGHTELGNYTRVVKHELMHAVESLLKGSDNSHLVDVWLTEGIAEHVAGGTAGGSVTTLAKLDELVATYGELNPVAMHRYDYPDIEGIGFYYYYPMFELAVKYLLDPAGLGKTKPSIRDILIDAGNGAQFTVSFGNQFGISLQDYEDEFFFRMREFLD